MLCETVDESAPLPVTIRGEDAGRQVRGGADSGHEKSRPNNTLPPHPESNSEKVPMTRHVTFMTIDDAEHYTPCERAAIVAAFLP